MTRITVYCDVINMGFRSKENLRTSRLTRQEDRTGSVIRAKGTGPQKLAHDKIQERFESAEVVELADTPS